MSLTTTTRLLATSALVATVALTADLRGAQGPSSSLVLPAGGGPILVPHIVDAARVLVATEGQLLVHNPGSAPLHLDALRVRLDGVLVEERPLDLELPGDARFGDVVARIERLPEEVSHRRRPRAFAAADAPEFGGHEVTAALQSIDADLRGLRAEWAAGAAPPFVALDFPVRLDQLFAPEAPAGALAGVTLELVWRPGAVANPTAAARRTTVATHAVRRLAPTRPLAATLAGSHVHPGDLHVHSCHGEATGACAPSGNCGAETLQTSGSFSYAQLKGQYQALGMDWFTATDHSYCIDSASEYDVVKSECAALTDGAFLAIPDTELSSDEQGAQSGSDLGDAICLGATSANHMGAHGISSWKHGGSQAFWGFCDGPFTDELEPFLSNIDKVRAEGGYPIANHPQGGEFGWNSFAATQGIEANDLHGVEVWNGATQVGQGSHVAQWIDWLEAGRLLYAYSGSDTHDQAFAFGANHVVLRAGEAFSTTNLETAIREGRVYLSNAHSLVLEGELGGDSLEMGSLQTLTPAQQGQPVKARVHYDFGADTATITVFAGHQGGSEAALASSGPLTGSGVYEVTYTPASAPKAWFRAYSESGTKTAYTNPVFLLPGSNVSAPYGVGLGGANVGTLASASAPDLGSTVALQLSGLAGAPTAILGLSTGSYPGGVPFAGGSLLVALPLALAIPVPLDGAGAGSFTFRMPWEPGFVGGGLYWQAAAPTPLQPGFLAFTNGLLQSIGALGQ